MSRIPPPIANVPSTPDFDFISGTYGESKTPITYFLTTMSFGEAAENLTLVSDLPGSADIPWKIEELYQRDIDWARVTKKIVPYLKNTEAPQFFNAITVALLPVKNNMIVGLNDSNWSAPVLRSVADFNNGCIENFGPISCGYWGKWVKVTDPGAKLGRICWNKKEIAAVAIDGQHRLAAIKEYSRGGRNENSRLPVILIVAHPKLGSTGINTNETMLTVTRKLFIDLNKNSVKVGRARQILLDDSDPVSECTRSLVGESLNRGDSEISSNRLPLSVIDWHSEKAKFETGPYLTTILGLDWVVSQVLDMDPIQDSMNYEKIEKTLTGLERSLGIDLKSAKDKLETAKSCECPFEFSVINNVNGQDDEANQSDIDLITSGFRDSWSPAIVYLLTNLIPYKQILKQRKDDDSLSPEFCNWWVAYSQSEGSASQRASEVLERIKDALKDKKIPSLTPAKFQENLGLHNQIKNEFPLAFTVVFQRALFHAFIQFRKIDIVDSGDEENGDSDYGSGNEDGPTQSVSYGKTRLESAKILVDSINKITNRHEFFSKSFCCELSEVENFWTYSFLKEDASIIDFSNAASMRAAELLLAAGCLELVFKSGKYKSRDFDKLWVDILNSEITDKILFKLNQACNKMKGDTGFAGKIANLRSEKKKGIDELREKEVRVRLDLLWKAISSKS